MNKATKILLSIIVILAVFCTAKTMKDTFWKDKIIPKKLSNQLPTKTMLPPKNFENTLPRDTKTHLKPTIKKLTKNTYRYTYQDLWIHITTTPQEDILHRNGNKIFKANTTSNAPDYIEVFFKDPTTSFEEEITKNQLPTWCQIETWNKRINITSIDGNLAGDENCKPDKAFPDNMLSISFFINPKKPDRYYKRSYEDCAPGPCSIFEKIDFF